MGRGGVAGNNARRKQDKNDQGERPDYLVEDEETWMPERRDVAPPALADGAPAHYEVLQSQGCGLPAAPLRAQRGLDRWALPGPCS
ncbi:hypothetical protein GCM10012287_48570 [Streptomyces daqingensis]|uniref:Transposase n=1 Tax=Streptomyces daqingensis TaxID=1472640 RepID=A0ABQ2MNT2_9ACTN|nr:hypothetical protein GCM10012287_48570 [Streptomyces daqingensis]